jgi:hypothetical protein
MRSHRFRLAAVSTTTRIFALALLIGSGFLGAVPAYPVQAATGSWSALGSGVDSSPDAVVYALAVDASNNVYAGGWFTVAGGNSADMVAKWDGSSWSALGSGMNNNVYALALDKSGNLYAGGDFSKAGGNFIVGLAKWDGGSWSAPGSWNGGTVYALAVDGSSNLYAGGAFSSAGGTSASDIAKWNGSSWSALGSGMNNVVRALAFDKSGNLYAGGDFTTAGTCSSGCNYIAKWNGSSWSALDGGMTGGFGTKVVDALAFDNSGNLYAAGQFGGAGSCTIGCYKLAEWNGSSWSALGGGILGGVNVFALAVDASGNVFLGGNFDWPYDPGPYIAKVHGNNWANLGSGLDDTVYALALDSSENLYAGGKFTSSDGTPISHIAEGNFSLCAISGNAGVGGATLSYTDVSPKTATADSGGNYRFTVSFGWTGTVRPSKPGYTFSPAYKSYTGITTDQTAQDYTAAIPLYLPLLMR